MLSKILTQPPALFGEKASIFHCEPQNKLLSSGRPLDGRSFTKMVSVCLSMILLMAEILHHLGCKKTVNNGINYLSTGAAFQPSTVWFDEICVSLSGEFVCFAKLVTKDSCIVKMWTEMLWWKSNKSTRFSTQVLQNKYHPFIIPS